MAGLTQSAVVQAQRRARLDPTKLDRLGCERQFPESKRSVPAVFPSMDTHGFPCTP